MAEASTHGCGPARLAWAACALALAACSAAPESSEEQAPPITPAPAVGGAGGMAAAAGAGWLDQWAAGQGGAGAAGAGGSVAAAGTGGAQAGVGGAGGAAGVAGASVAGSAAPMPQVTTYPLTLGPIHLMPDEEVVVCTTVRLGNQDEVFLPHIRGELQKGSHHFIAYRSVDPVENRTPTPCTSFAGVFASGGAEGPLMIVERPSDALLFPSGVALKLTAGQMILLELHAINTTTEPIDAGGTFYFDTLPLSDEIVESNMAFWGTLTIAIAPSSPGTTGVLFQPGNPGTKAFALTTHQHRLGTRFRVWHSSTPGDTSKPPIAETLDWSDPPLYRLEPEIAFDGSNGLSFQCDWQNTTDQLITFGESALQEMCFLWMYYYPSVGFDARFF